MLKLVKRSIFAQGFLIVSISVVVQAIFFLSYGKLLDQASLFSRRESVSKATIGRVNWLATLQLLAVCSRAYEWLTHEPAKPDETAYLSTQIAGQYSELRDLVAANEEQRQCLERLCAASSSLDEQLQAFSLTASPTSPATVAQIKKLKQAIKLAGLERSKFLALDREQNALSADWMPRTQSAVRGWLLIGFVINIGGTLLVFLVFFFGVASRLQSVKAKIVSYRSGSPFPPAVSISNGGSDEISLVEENLFSMAKEIEERERRKQELLSMVSHDLRTPLTTVAGIVRLLELGVIENSAAKQMAEIHRVGRSVKVLLSLVNDLLDMDKLEAGMIELDRHLIDLSGPLKEAMELVQDQAEAKGIAIQWLGPDVVINADSGRLMQILVNLLVNAIKYSEAGASVEISAEEKEEAGAVVVRVRDHGRGIPDEFKRTIFERFRQVELADSKKGSGLGLAICMTLVQLHGGKLWVEDAIAGGSCFSFELPDIS